ncbi:hypothetical protein DL96DRAFT_1666988 [Flagelloscypha sp. PMI_526]|nr:hypothetical protein DL96DRAFT_1666988 [Flagelloscypha sp. PMI_526]
MDLGANMSAKLEPFLLMAKSAKGAGAVKLIKDATSAPGVFVFSELFELPGIQELSKSKDNAPGFRLLELFSYGTYPDYANNKSSYPELNAAQTTKLKYLTLVSLAEERRIIPYSDLLSLLEMPSIRTLEDLIIDAIYLDILRAKLDQKEGQLEVEYTMGRDLNPKKIDDILAALTEWSSTTATVLSTLDNKIDSIAKRAAQQKKRSEAHETRVQTVLKEVQDKQKESNKQAGGGSMAAKVRGALGNLGNFGRSSVYDRDDMMDIDDMETSKGKNRKAPPSSSDAKRNKRNRY